jgi:chlorite dismutase
VVAEPLLVTFVGGDAGAWAVESIEAVTGAGLPPVARLAVIEGAATDERPSGSWVLGGVVSNERYTSRQEHEALAERQEPLGRSAATRAALIPITKSLDWWALSQDQRRAILEETSHHIAIGLEYLPAVARRLHHGRDLGESFHFLTWFEFAPEDAIGFEELVARLRATPEWSYVTREVDIRLTRG